MTGNQQSGNGARKSRSPGLFAQWVQHRIHPDRGSIELPGRAARAVRPERLEGAERERLWHRFTVSQPRYRKHPSKTERGYPLVRLAPR